MKAKIITALILGIISSQSYAALESSTQHRATGEKQTKMASQSGVDFLAQNKNQPGVKTTMTGLQYKVIKEGTGEMPTDNDTIVVNYQGTTIDGKEFDSSYKRGQPMAAPLKYMIPGWVEALQMMKKGSVWMLYIPANLAYGERGAPPVIAPNQTLIFKVELLDVKKA